MSNYWISLHCSAYYCHYYHDSESPLQPKLVYLNPLQPKLDYHGEEPQRNNELWASSVPHFQMDFSTIGMIREHISLLTICDDD
jgi:hypothetical protein